MEQFNLFHAPDHIFHTNIIAYCQQNGYLRLAILNKKFYLSKRKYYIKQKVLFL